MNVAKILSAGLFRPKSNFKLYNNAIYSKSEFATSSAAFHPVQAFKLADIGEGIKEVTIKQWFVKPSQNVQQFDDLCEVESDKASVVLTSRYEGEIKNLYYKEGDIAPVGSILLDIQTEEDPVKIEVIEERKIRNVRVEEVKKIEAVTHGNGSVEEFVDIQEQVLDDVTSDTKPIATPAVRRIAKEYNVNINTINGTGKGGRVSKEDILNYINQPAQNPTESTGREIISGYKKTMVKTMTESSKIPTMIFGDEIDVSELQSIRKNLVPSLANENIKITPLAFLVKAISLSLQKYPILNSIFHVDRNEIEYLDYHNIGIAIDTERGLVVPNIKNAHNLSIKSIAKEIARLQNAAIKNELTLKDNAGGTFTISNIGSIGGTVTKPLILPPQVAIVGVGRIQLLPRFDENHQIKKASVINLSWAADHRIIDGGTIARFSNSVKMYMEKPMFFVIDG